MKIANKKRLTKNNEYSKNEVEITLQHNMYYQTQFFG